MNSLSEVPVEGLLNHSYVLLISMDGKILYKNEKWNTVIGSNDAIQSVFDLITPFEIPKLKAVITHLAESHESSVSYSFKANNLFGNENCFEAKFYFFQDETENKI